MSLRAIWRVNYKDKDSAENLIASKRRDLDEKLAKIKGVHFFFSSITGTRTNAKTSRKEKDKLDANQQGSSSDKKNDSMSDETEDLFSHFYPGIAYFIAFTPVPLVILTDFLNFCTLKTQKLRLTSSRHV